jgi:hypothetical protein
MKAMKMQGIRQGTRTGNAVDFWRKKGFQGSRSQLACFAGINGVVGSITFPILSTQQNNANTVYGLEKRLNISDSFIVLSCGIFLTQSPKGATAAAPTAVEIASTTIHTFPNPAAASFDTKADELQNVYNGFLSIKIGNVNWFPSISMRTFYRVPQTQQSSATTTDEYQRDQGIMKLTPTLTLNGNGNNDFTVTFASASVDMASASTSKFNGLLLYLDGIILPNAAGKVDLETSNAFATQFGR